jgi:hypothetical protein
MAINAPQQLNTLKKVDWRKVVSYANPQSVKDLDVFLDKLPARAGMNSIIAAAVIWGIAGAALLLAYTKSVDLRALHKDLATAEALRPTVPTISYAPIPDDQIKIQVEKLKTVYKSLTINVASGTVTITAGTTGDFNAWRSAIGDLSYGGNGWRVRIKQFCAGRECKDGKPLQASLSVQQMDITIPEAKPTT